MDYVRLELEVKEKAKEYLEDISEDNLRAFAESTKLITQSVLESYILKIDDHYSEGCFKIQDRILLNRFNDFHSGYRVTMKSWITDHEIQIQEKQISLDIETPQIPSYLNIKPLIVGSVGTLIAVGLIIISDLWVFLAAELLILATAYKINKDETNAKQSEYEFNVKQYELQLQQEKTRLIRGVIQDLKAWLRIAEEYSNDILKEYEITT